MSATVREVTRDLLRAYGLTTIFGNPGTTEIGFLQGFPEDFRYVLGLQESVVVAMADGYAHASGRPVLVNLHSAGGVGHGLGHLFTAYRNNTPMIVLAGQQIRSLLPGEPFLGALDATMFPRPYVKWSVEPARAQDVPAALARAYHVATQPPYGPVFVSVPADDWDAEGDPLPPRPPLPGFAPDPAALAELVSAVDGAANPALVVGPGVDAEGAIPDVVELAERARAGVWASPMSWRSSFPEDHPQFLGFLPPEEQGTIEALQDHDLVVVLGAPVFLYHVYRGSSDLTLPPLYLVSDDEQVLARASTGTGIRSGVRAAVRALADAVAEPARAVPAGRARRAAPAGVDADHRRVGVRDDGRRAAAGHAAGRGDPQPPAGAPGVPAGPRAAGGPAEHGRRRAGLRPRRPRSARRSARRAARSSRCWATGRACTASRRCGRPRASTCR